jgi:hypothetical protein
MVLLDPPTPASTKHADTKARSHRAIKPVEQELVKEVIQTKKEGDAGKPAPKAIVLILCCLVDEGDDD